MPFSATRSTMALFRAGALILLIGGIAAVEPAFAGEAGIGPLGAGYTAHDAPLGAPADLRIDLRGEVGQRCRMGSPPVLTERLDFNRQGQTQSRFGLDCNTPFRLRVRSGEGGFATRSALEGVARNIPYEVGIDVDTDRGLSALGWCRADQLSDQAGDGCAFGGTGWSSGDATAIDRTGTMRMRWQDRGEGDDPALGEYRDTIIVEITVRA